jgi:hypothetical protein
MAEYLAQDLMVKAVLRQFQGSVKFLLKLPEIIIFHL